MASSVLHQHGGHEWRLWRQDPEHAIPEIQAGDGSDAGSWARPADTVDAGGRIGATALCVLTLQSFHRYARIARQERRIGDGSSLTPWCCTGSWSASV